MSGLIFSSLFQDAITFESIMIATAAALVIGVVIAWVYMYKNTTNKNFAVTLAILPVMIQIVIMMVNGNLGTSVAVLGAFSLIRFRSVPGNARDISSIFFAMATGLACGMGYVVFACFITMVVGAWTLILLTLPFGERRREEKLLKILIPESLDFDGIFDDLFKEYTLSNQLLRVKTTNMGSLFELQYAIIMKDETQVKELIDHVRIRNGNLNIVCGRMSVNREEL